MLHKHVYEFSEEDIVQAIKDYLGQKHAEDSKSIVVTFVTSSVGQRVIVKAVAERALGNGS